MHSNVWHDRNLCSTNLCDLCLTRIISINKSHTEICRYTVLWCEYDVDEDIVTQEFLTHTHTHKISNKFMQITVDTYH